MENLETLFSIKLDHETLKRYVYTLEERPDFKRLEISQKELEDLMDKMREIADRIEDIENILNV